MAAEWLKAKVNSSVHIITVETEDLPFKSL
jgi:hypothetical protein